jgi:hypothetical protein
MRLSSTQAHLTVTARTVLLDHTDREEHLHSDRVTNHIRGGGQIALHPHIVSQYMPTSVACSHLSQLWPNIGGVMLRQNEEVDI